MSADDQRPLVVTIMGPTASGKTGLAVELVQRLPLEIVSVDSAMVYRQMDIGTAKPDAATLALAPHHLIDIADPADSYSAARFRRDALGVIEALRARGRVPLLVGGTMLYYRALLQGLTPLPESDPAVRARLEGELAERGLGALRQRLLRLDPAAAARIHPNDPQRTLRALEVRELSGRPMSELWREGGEEPFPYRVLKLMVAPADRAVLHRHIEDRFRQMLEAGLVAEVEALRARGDLSPDLPSMRAVGYRQVWEYLDGLTSRGEMVQRGMAATRQLARRQLTWLRAEPGVQALESGSPRLVDQALDIVAGAGLP